jgi:hypothetical protein
MRLGWSSSARSTTSNAAQDFPWAAHLDAVLKKAIEDFKNGITTIDPPTDGFKGNKTLPILGGASDALYRRIPKASFRDIMPKHLLPLHGISVVPLPHQNPPPVPRYLPDALSNTTAPAHDRTIEDGITSRDDAIFYGTPNSVTGSTKSIPTPSICCLTPTPHLTPPPSSTSRRPYIPPAGALPSARGGAASTALTSPACYLGHHPLPQPLELLPLRNRTHDSLRGRR